MRGKPSGVEGMWDGGAGNEEMSSGTTSLCLKLEDEVAMAVGGQKTRKPEPKEEREYIPRSASGGMLRIDWVE